MKYEIQYLPIGDVRLNPNNPRLIKDVAFRKLVKSLKGSPDMFDARPLLCSDRTGELIIIGGNMRLRAAAELDYETVPVIVMTGLTERQEREIAIKDNGSFGEWDFDTLANEWADLPLEDWGIEGLNQIIPDEVNASELSIPEKDPNILVRLSFHPGLWLGKREEIMDIFDKIEKAYNCQVKVEE